MRKGLGGVGKTTGKGTLRLPKGIALSHRPLLWVASGIAVFYLAIIFPLCFFRHDDWWILGNSVLHLPKDWGFLWRPTLFFGDREISWFFRPFFKLFTLGFYQVFSFHYYLWVFTLFTVFVATVWMGHRALSQFSNQRVADTFALFFLVAVPLHLGSLAWIGEGLMNIPQAFLLMVVTAAWLSLAKEKSFHFLHPALWWGIAAFILSLGFKESTVFHLAWMAGVTLSEAKFGFRKKPRVWCLYFSPFVVIAAIYLTIRLGWMPWNQSYRPEFSLRLWTLSAARFLSVPVTAVALWVALDAGFNGQRWRFWAVALLRRAWWLPYFAVSTVVYLGQNFFSPGWWYLPSLFVAFAVAFAQSDVDAAAEKSASRQSPASYLPRNSGRVALVSFAFFLSLSLWQLTSLGWWSWGKLQRQMHQIMLIAKAEEISAFTFYECKADKYPGIDLYRVVGDAEAFRNHWRLLHDRPLQVAFRHCGYLKADLRKPTSIEKVDEAVFAWKFPEIIGVGEKARHLIAEAASQMAGQKPE